MITITIQQKTNIKKEKNVNFSIEVIIGDLDSSSTNRKPKKRSKLTRAISMSNFNTLYIYIHIENQPAK